MTTAIRGFSKAEEVAWLPRGPRSMSSGPSTMTSIRGAAAAGPAAARSAAWPRMKALRLRRSGRSTREIAATIGVVEANGSDGLGPCSSDSRGFPPLMIASLRLLSRGLGVYFHRGFIGCGDEIAEYFAGEAHLVKFILAEPKVEPVCDLLYRTFDVIVVLF